MSFSTCPITKYHLYFVREKLFFMETIKDLGKYTFPALLNNSVRKFCERPALSVVKGTPITYGQLLTKSKSVSKMLVGLGLTGHAKIALWATGRPEWGESYFGIVNQGFIAVPLLPDFSETEIESIMGHCGVDALIVQESLYNHLKNIQDKLPPIIIKLEDFSIIRAPEEFAGKTGIADFETVTLPVVQVEEEDTASIIYTSGTTGRSKGVELSHKSLVWSAISGQEIYRVHKLDHCLSFLPLSHVYEFSIGFSMQLLNGAHVTYLGKPPTVSALIPAFSIVRPSIILSVPLIVEKIYKAKVVPELTKNDFMKKMYGIRPVQKILHRIAGKKIMKTFGGNLIFFGIGGSKVDPNVEQFMKDAKFPYAIGYGLTETAPLIGASGVPETIPGTIGHPIAGVDMKIANPDPETGVGEIVVKGPNVMKGYYKDPELTAAAFTTEEDSCGPGYFKTGDLGLFEKRRGRDWLSLKGRSKNMILGPSGENIYPEDIEFVLNQHPAVSESLVVEDDAGLVALVKVDEEKLEKEVRADLEAKKSTYADFAAAVKEEVAYRSQALMSEIQFFVNSKVNRTSKIGKVTKVDEFEKTASQKIKRYLYDLKNKVVPGKKDE